MDSTFLLKYVLEALDNFVVKTHLPSNIVKSSTENLEEVRLPKDFPDIVLQFSSSLKEKAQTAIEQSKTVVNPDSVQITASKAQLDQRIAAFISHAQNAVDEQNIQEFFPGSYKDVQHDGCARTHALYRRRASYRTHMQVNRIKNTEGPQTQINSQGRWCSVKRKEPSKDTSTICPEAVQERLINLETHLRLRKNSAPKDVYARLKSLEDRMLELESRSPEYFHNDSDAVQRRSRSSSLDDQQQTNLEEIDDRIRYLKQKLLNKRFKTG